jgi:calcium/calmodulin-dependent protein kinase I
VLLCGFSPFLSSTQHGLFDKIVKCEYDFPDPEWTNISESAKDFIRHLLVKEPKERYTASQCLKHPWLNVRCQGFESTNLSQGDSGTGALANGRIQEKMQTYNENRKMSFKK